MVGTSFLPALKCARKPPDRLQMTVMQIGIVMLGAIMIFVTHNDLTRLL